jgi:hypothetical protein
MPLVVMKAEIDRVVRAALDDQNGPLISSGASEDQQRSFDKTCRKFHLFLKDRNPENP